MVKKSGGKMNYQQLAELIIKMNQTLIEMIKEIDELRNSFEKSGIIKKQ